MADIIYTYNNRPYLNITNRCPCACTFCVRGEKKGLGSADTLWHAVDPSWAEVERALQGYDFSQAEQAVFCGYGEPFCALEILRRSAAWLKEHYPALQLRVNTNGLGDLIHGRPVAGELAGLVDSMSISLNAPSAARYEQLVRPRFGEKAYPAMLDFARQCKSIYPKVTLSVVDILAPEEIEQCRDIADAMGLPLRVRKKT